MREALRGAIRERLAQDPSARLAENAPAADYLLRVEGGWFVQRAEDGSEGRPVSLTLRPTGAGQELQATGRGLPLTDVAASLLAGFDDAWQVLRQQRWLLGGEDQRLIDALTSPDARLRDFAIQELGERKSGAAVPALSGRLAVEPRAELQLRIVGALVAIGDRRAAEPIIELARNKSPEVVIQVVFALAALGGRTAEGYLVTLAGGYPHPAVQQAATEALAELARKARPAD